MTTICSSNGCEFQNIVGEFSYHPSVIYIKSNFIPKTFNFQSVTSGDIYNILKSMKGNKATGCDNIPTKLLIVAAHMLCEPLRYLVNLSIHTSAFSDLLKMGEVSPAQKRGM